MSSDPQQDELKSLFQSAFFAEELKTLHHLQTWVEDPVLRPRSVSQILPEAIQQSADLRAEALTEALKKPVERTLQKAIHKNPQPFIDILTPIIGSTIRKAITETLQSMVRSLNEVLERGLSIKGLRWRWEAYRTNRPLAEVVLVRTLIYQVESIFLVHRQTGQLLTHVERPLNPFHSPKMATELVNSLGELAQVSFKEGETRHIEKIDFGEYSVLIEGGHHVVLALAVRGTPPHSLRTVMRETLEEVEMQYQWAIDPKSGPPIATAKMNELLQSCLIAEFKSANQRWSWAVAIGLVIFPLFILSIRMWQDGRQWNSYLAKLNATPGIIVLDSKRSLFDKNIVGLRDPRSVSPNAVLVQAEYSKQNLHQKWIPFNSPSKELEQLEEDRTEIRSLARRASTTILYFETNTDQLTSLGESNLDLVADLLIDIIKIAEQTAQTIRLEISGYTGADVAIEKQVPLSLARARKIKSVLESRFRGVAQTQLVGLGYTVTAPQEGAIATVNVMLDDIGSE